MDTPRKLPAEDSRPLKVLILKPSSLGDVVQALPVLRLIKQQIPSSRVFWWIESGLAGLLEGDPDLAGIVRFNRKGWARAAYWKKFLADIRWMRSQQFDWVLDLQSLARSGTVAWLANGKLAIGLDDPREGAGGFYDIAVPRAGYRQHAVDWYLSTLPRLGVQQREFTWLPARTAAANSVRQKWDVASPKWVAVQPGARWENKRWPVESYAAAVRQIATASPDARFALLGGAADKPLTSQIAKAAPDRCLDLAGAVSLAEMIEWIRLSSVMISNDTGPMHVAAALGTPLVALFGPTNPDRTGPYGHLSEVVRVPMPCAPCMRSKCSRHDRPLECLTAIQPEKVARIACEHLQAGRSR